MLNFRRKPAPVDRVEPKAAKAGPAPATNADKARALIAMLENGGDGASVPSERLRDWARDLVNTVERRPGQTQPPRTASPAAREAAAPARLFSTAPPVLTEGPPVAVPQSAPAAHAPDAVPACEPVSRTATAGRLTLTAPMPHAEKPAARSAVPSVPPVHAPADIRRLVDATVDPGSVAGEHPAVIAMTLAGKPPLEQAGALRRLPTGQIRAVHRALRQIESASA